MIPLPKPRGFWDYTLFALLIAGVLLLLFWMEASGGVGWADGALALGSAVLLGFVHYVCSPKRESEMDKAADYARLFSRKLSDVVR